MPTDPLGEVLAMLKPHTVIAGGFDAGGQWSIGFEAHTGVKCYAVLSGACWLGVEGVEGGLRLEAGACILLPHGRRFCFTNDLRLEPVPFRELDGVSWHGGIATLNGGGDALVLGGHFAFAGPQADMLLSAMPPVATLRGERERETLRWSLERMRRELMDDLPGGTLVAQHLAHLVLVQALRWYLGEGAGRHVGWLFALGDVQLSAAIIAMHAEPECAWTVSELAKLAGMSRAGFSQVFTTKVGTSPIDYLTRWRMLLAGHRLRQRGERVSIVARALGYQSERAFSTAFRRVMGCSPKEYARPSGDDHSFVRWGPDFGGAAIKKRE